MDSLQEIDGGGQAACWTEAAGEVLKYAAEAALNFEPLLFAG